MYLFYFMYEIIILMCRDPHVLFFLEILFQFQLNVEMLVTVNVHAASLLEKFCVMSQILGSNAES
jgi:hypothetical protein